MVDLSKLTESDRRNFLIRLARARYIKTGITKSITEACRLLLDADIEGSETLTLFISGRESDRPRTILDEYVRPLCPDCGGKLFLKEKCSGMAKGDRITIWICKKCGYKDYSEKSLKDWLLELPKKDPGEY